MNPKTIKQAFAQYDLLCLAVKDLSTAFVKHKLLDKVPELENDLIEFGIKFREIENYKQED